jgi:hypothetical protein
VTDDVAPAALLAVFSLNSFDRADIFESVFRQFVVENFGFDLL